MTKLSVELERYFFEEERASDVKLADILSLAGERIFGFLFIILALPSALPVPAPGYSVPFGILMFILAIQLAAGYKVLWFPERIMKGSIKLETVQKFLEKGLPWLKKIETLTRPRMTYICTSLPGRVVIGVAIALMSIFMMIPIPGTNTLPAIGIFVTAFGLQEDDGFISLGGLVICLIAGTMSTLIIFLGKEVIGEIFRFIKWFLGS
ncbi:exopolysaccharide synthesis protein [cyanobacterium endosymbiont of Rhopalodia gibberula]|uniref:exopolysaccharide biosynthesis protein n=1 Tax=cyanobacterium endosymbiont of Rhopalodia gibberula TaxID=1763363 RepID=UPI000DC7019F|nr:exopolysaccharide biosynthesis protein [cyanobacterium endosymbiont of Rhopalodia gibberula]BBA78768.1 exopolysaccharide synthesis protein [cyanobacterium endosymbiont of Rhopalodia gibberula]